MTPEVWSTVFHPNGVCCRPVLDAKGAELKTVVQLVVQEEVSVEVEGLATERCARCGQSKLLPVARGAFPSLANEPSVRMAKTRQYFGSGASAYQGILVSQELARALAAEKVKGASVRPVAAPPARNPTAVPPP